MDELSDEAFTVDGIVYDGPNESSHWNAAPIFMLKNSMHDDESKKCIVCTNENYAPSSGIGGSGSWRFRPHLKVDMDEWLDSGMVLAKK